MLSTKARWAATTRWSTAGTRGRRSRCGARRPRSPHCEARPGSTWSGWATRPARCSPANQHEITACHRRPAAGKLHGGLRLRLPPAPRHRPAPRLRLAASGTSGATGCWWALTVLGSPDPPVAEHLSRARPRHGTPGQSGPERGAAARRQVGPSGAADRPGGPEYNVGRAEPRKGPSRRKGQTRPGDGLRAGLRGAREEHSLRVGSTVCSPGPLPLDRGPRNWGPLRSCWLCSPRFGEPLISPNPFL